MKTVKTRIKNDFYPTPDRLVRAYLSQNPNQISRNEIILEPCVGEGAIANPLRELGYKVEGTDITDGIEFDATTDEYWEGRSPDTIISNPPFNVATPIIQHALKRATKRVIMLLRASYLEPCKDRRDVLKQELSRFTIVNPRPKFRSDTKGSDSATVAFFVWDIGSGSSIPTIDFLTDWHK